jgi:hypothetical protein
MVHELHSCNNSMSAALQVRRDDAALHGLGGDPRHRLATPASQRVATWNTGVNTSLNAVTHARPKAENGNGKAFSGPVRAGIHETNLART